VSELPDELAALGIEEVRVARVQPGDVIVLMTSKQIGQEQAEVMYDQLKALFEGHRVAILEDGMFLEVLRPEPPATVQAEWNANSGDGFVDTVRKFMRMQGLGGAQ